MHKALAQRSVCGSGLGCRSVGTSSRSVRASKVARLAPVRTATEEVAVSTNGSVAAVAGSSNMMDFDELSQIVKMVHETDIIELELKSKKFTLALRKREAIKAAEPIIQMMAAPMHQMQMQHHQQAPPPAAPAPAPAPAAAAPPPPPPPPAAKPAGKVEGVEMLSPMAGTFYMRPAPGEAAFVKEGDKVKKGQVVGIIEAMKLMNEIEAEISGEVVKFLIPDKSAVSPGQPILLIKP